MYPTHRRKEIHGKTQNLQNLRFSWKKVPPKYEQQVVSKNRTLTDFDLNHLKIFLREVQYVLQNILKCAGGVLIYLNYWIP